MPPYLIHRTLVPGCWSELSAESKWCTFEGKTYKLGFILRIENLSHTDENPLYDMLKDYEFSNGSTQCSILKSTLVKCHFGSQRRPFFLGTSQKCVMQSEGLSKNCPSQNPVVTICKLKYSWTPILALYQTLPDSNNSCNFDSATWTRHWLQLQLGKHNYTWIFQTKLGEEWSQLETLDALMQVSLYGLPMENMDWARIFNIWKSTLNQRTLRLELDDD